MARLRMSSLTAGLLRPRSILLRCSWVVSRGTITSPWFSGLPASSSRSLRHFSLNRRNLFLSSLTFSRFLVSRAKLYSSSKQICISLWQYLENSSTPGSSSFTTMFQLMSRHRVAMLSCFSAGVVLGSSTRGDITEQQQQITSYIDSISLRMFSFNAFDLISCCYFSRLLFFPCLSSSLNCLFSLQSFSDSLRISSRWLAIDFCMNLSPLCCSPISTRYLPKFLQNRLSHFAFSLPAAEGSIFSQQCRNKFWRSTLLPLFLAIAQRQSSSCTNTSPLISYIRPAWVMSSAAGQSPLSRIPSKYLIAMFRSYSPSLDRLILKQRVFMVSEVIGCYLYPCISLMILSTALGSTFLAAFTFCSISSGGTSLISTPKLYAIRGPLSCPLMRVLVRFCQAMVLVDPCSLASPLVRQL